MKRSGEKINKPAKPRKTRKIRGINIGVVIILLVFAYLALNVFISLRKDHLAIYEVQAATMALDDNARAVIIRNEKNYYTDKAGYTNFYVRSGARVAVNDTVYSIDESKNIFDYLKDYDVNYTFSAEDTSVIKNYIYDFNDEYSDDNYSVVYELKESIISEILNISDNYLLENLDELLEEGGETPNFSLVKSDASGVVSFFSDSLDGLTADEVTPSTFDNTGYTSKNLYDAEIKEQNALIYKIINDDSWELVINLNEDQYTKLSENKSISFTVKDDGMKFSEKCSFYTKDGGYFCKLELGDYMIRYIRQRFLDLQLVIQTDAGLKIPATAVTEKEFYVIPEEYYTEYEIENEVLNGFTYMNYDPETRQTSYEFVEADCYYHDTDRGVVYVDTKDFTYGQYVYCMEDETQYQVSVIEKLKGVYNVNKGYAVFRRIEFLSESDDYCIVRAGAARSLSEHDHIALNAKLINENLQIY